MQNTEQGVHVACRVASLREGMGRVVRVADRELAVFLVEARVFAVDNACLHTGASLADGLVRGTDLVCASHGWVYDLGSGVRRVAAGTTPGVRCYDAWVHGDDVLVRISG